MDVISRTRGGFFGRKRIFAKYNTVSSENVLKILKDAVFDFRFNRKQIRFLWNYYRGVQPVLDRTKAVRPEICNKVVENHAQECVNFKIGYQLSDPVQYISRAGKDDERVSSQIKLLNDLMFAEGKASSDHDLFEWLCVCGVGYRMVCVDKEEDYEPGGAPFKFFVLNPMNTFVIYSPEFDHKVLLNVLYSVDRDGNTFYDIYSVNKYWKIKNMGDIVEEKDNFLGLPVIEYCLNNARMGVFEPVLPILDAINAIESNRLDGIEQTVQSLMKFVNCDIDEESFQKMLAIGAVKVQSTTGVNGDVEMLSTELDQTQTQITKEDLYQAFLNITGMPDRNGSGNSDTGAAVLLRDGWTLAESHAKSYELEFKKAERNFLRVVFKICDAADKGKYDAIDLRIRDIDMAFNRRNYDNLLTRVQALTQLLATDKVHPLIAWQSCGLVTDPDAAYMMSVEYQEEQQEKAAALQEATAQEESEEEQPAENLQS